MCVCFFLLLIRKKKKTSTEKIISDTNNNNLGIILKCTKCGNKMEVNHKFCAECGEPFDQNNVKVEMDTNVISNTSKEKIVTVNDFDSMFNLSEEAMLSEFINRELIKANIDQKSKLIPSAILKKRRILNIIFSFLLFCFISLIFFHFPLFTYLCGIIILFIAFKLTKSYNFMKYLKKKIKSRPSEKISNIIMSEKQTMVKDTSGKVLYLGMLVAIILPMIIFIKPMIWYEKMDGGYGVRYYIFGLTNFKTATIPETYKNLNVISLRGNTFSNMPFLKEVILPNTIVEIRGQAFKNNKSLRKVKLPSNLNYLGGGAFYNCTSIESIEIPNSVTYIGGEAFYNAKSLKNIKLSNNITEIKGSTFENCSSLESIDIPDEVTRIGGHAFYGNSSLTSVNISEKSKLKEIGSSAFRKCNNLYEIIIPRDTYVNERAFKESPTEVKTYSISSKYGFQYDEFMVMQLGDTTKINNYMLDAITQNEYISLENIVENNGLYEFVFSVNGQQFTLTNSYRYHLINNNLAIEIDSDYVFTYYSDQISFYVYYN